VRFRDHWHAVALSRELGERPVRRLLFGAPIALWRGPAGVAAVEDVCPHRGAPLSGGVVVDGALVCPYHGYRFASDGRCVHVPITGGSAPVRARVVAAREEEGLVWASFGAPAHEPPRLGLGAGWGRVWVAHVLPAPFELVVENFMDSGHTGILHRGIIRGDQRVARDVTVERAGDSVHVRHHPCAEDVGVLRGWLGGGETSHTDVFTRPATIRVDYDLGGGRAFAALLYCSPTTDAETTLYAALAVRLGALNPLARVALPALARRVLRQDAEITGAVARNLRQSGARPGFAPSDVMHRLVAELLATEEALPGERHALTLHL
jgi:phenylpropionate dioxygenase-like ring-hydroxylating dioxygenase large terminal subunit